MLSFYCHISINLILRSGPLSNSLCADLLAYAEPLRHLVGSHGNAGSAQPQPAIPEAHGQQSGIPLPAQMEGVCMCVKKRQNKYV